MVMVREDVVADAFHLDGSVKVERGAGLSPFYTTGIDCSSLRNDSFGVVVLVSHVGMTSKIRKIDVKVGKRSCCMVRWILKVKLFIPFLDNAWDTNPSQHAICDLLVRGECKSRSRNLTI
jgi:hypothetical protein